MSLASSFSHRRPQALRDDAERIIERWVRENSPDEINVPHKVRMDVVKDFDESRIAVGMFDSAREVLMDSMELDSLPRFLRSPFYQAALPDHLRSGSSAISAKAQKQMAMAASNRRRGSVAAQDVPAMFGGSAPAASTGASDSDNSSFGSATITAPGLPPITPKSSKSAINKLSVPRGNMAAARILATNPESMGSDGLKPASGRRRGSFSFFSSSAP